MDKIGDIAEGLAKAYNVKLRGFDAPGQDKSKRKMLKTFADIAARWPKAMENLKHFEFAEHGSFPGGFGDESTLAHVWTAKEDININPGNNFKKGEMALRFRRSDSETAYDVDLQDSVDAGWAAPNTNSVEGTMMHELSHVLSLWSEEVVLDEVGGWLEEYYADNDSVQKPLDLRDRGLLDAMQKEASGYSFRYDDVHGNMGTKPTMFDHHEFTAEAFADAEINGDKAWGLSKFIHGKMVEAYDNYAK
jgi:hypothetical protein